MGGTSLMKIRTQFTTPEDTKHKTTLLNLLKERAYRKGQYTLSSGKQSEHYVNCKPVTLSCEGNALLSHLLLPHIDHNAVAVGGLTLGADPLVIGISQKSYYKGNRHIDALIVRKNPKDYGTQEVIEGHKPPEGSVITVLEDVTTTGASALIAVNTLRQAGYIVNRVVTIIDRMDDHKIWDDNNIEFKSLYHLNDLISV
jgi:orotate phosphoribosyltransferase